MRLLTLFITIAFPLATLAQVHPYLNDREGASRLVSQSNARELQRLEAQAPRARLEPAFRQTLPAANVRATEACAITWARSLETVQAQFPVYRNKGELFLKAFRWYGLIDDVVLDNLLKAREINGAVSASADDTWVNPTGNVDASLRPFLEFSQRRARGKCLNENFRDLFGALRQGERNFGVRNLGSRVDAAYRARLLTEKGRDELRAAARFRMDEWRLSLAGYLEKKQFLRTQFPLRDANERTDFTGRQAGRSSNSHRQRLYELYSPIQISLMGDLIRNLRRRIDSPRMELHIHDRSDNVEVIPFEPMERFRMSIRLLRRDQALLAANSFFNGQAPSFTDLITAAYEMSVVPATEIDTVANLQEMWDPRKTFWEQYAIWARLAAGTLGVVIPPPYGFIPSLAVVVADGFLRQNPDDDTDTIVGL